MPLLTNEKGKEVAKKTFDSELEGQIAFFKNFKIDYENEENRVLIEHTDGVWNGVLMEFKLSISNLDGVVFQAIKYLSKMRLHGRDVPATILIIDLNKTTVYEYETKNYKADIHKVYSGAASKNNTGFVAGKYKAKYDYSTDVGASKVRHILTDSKTLKQSVFPIDIDKNCVVAWSNRYYRENPNAKKGDFLGDDDGQAVQITGEIREPKAFKGRINPYTVPNNNEFKFQMDMLNDRLSKKELGAYYTPPCIVRRRRNWSKQQSISFLMETTILF